MHRLLTAVALVPAALLLPACSAADTPEPPTPSRTASPASPAGPSPSRTAATTSEEPSPDPSPTLPATPDPTATPTEDDPTPSPTSTPGGGAGTTTVPTALRGTWTAVESADERPTTGQCSPGGTSAGAIIVLTGREIRFFETTARLREVRERAATRVSGNFAFPDPVNDGPDTIARLTLEVRQDGRVLVYQDAAERGTRLYARCPG